MALEHSLSPFLSLRPLLISLNVMNTTEEIDRFIDAVKKEFLR